MLGYQPSSVRRSSSPRTVSSRPENVMFLTVPAGHGRTARHSTVRYSKDLQNGTGTVRYVRYSTDVRCGAIRECSITVPVPGTERKSTVLKKSKPEVRVCMAGHNTLRYRKLRNNKSPARHNLGKCDIQGLKK